MIETRPYQERIVTKTMGYFAEGISSVMVSSPTGSGKSYVGLRVAKEMEKLGYRTGWVAMRRNLLAQAKKENDEKVGVKNIEFISMFQRELPKVDFIIFDEVQHSGAPTAATMLNIIKPKKWLGMSATPYRSDRIQLTFQKVVQDAGIHILIQDGYLSPYHHYVIDKYTPQTVTDLYASDIDKWGKSVMFFLTKEECFAAKEMLLKRGIDSEVVTGDSNREVQLGRFESGDIKVVINMFILSEGFDSPDLKTAFVRPSSKGPTIQMGGRVFRKHPSKPYAQIVQCQETKYPFPNNARPLNQLVLRDGKWYSVKGNDNVAKAYLTSIRCIATTKDVRMPPFIAGRIGRLARRRNHSFVDTVIRGAVVRGPVRS